MIPPWVETRTVNKLPNMKRMKVMAIPKPNMPKNTTNKLIPPRLATSLQINRNE